MSEVTGGLRARFIWDSVFHALNDALTALNWFDTNRRHAPITFVAKPYESLEEIPPNTLTLSEEEVDSRDAELGSLLQEKSREVWVDFFGENDVLSTHLMNDIADLLQGLIPGVGPNIPVYDYTTATPNYLFSVEVDNVQIARGRFERQISKASWVAVSFTITDTYGAGA